MALAEPASHDLTNHHLDDDEGPALEVTALPAWDSRYVTEGRDNLDGEGISSFTLEAEYHGFLFGIWVIHGDGADYQEQNYYVEYGFEFAGMDAYVSYNHLEFASDGVRDNEIGAGLTGPELICGLVPAVDWYYSIDAQGSFYELSLSHECEVGERFTLTPSVVFGINDRYIADGHRGANHLVLQLGAAYEICESVSLEGYVAQTFAINSDPANFADDASLKDFFYGGVALSISF